MAFDDVDDSVETILGFSQYCEVVVVGEVSALDVELVDPVVVTHVLLPDLLNVGVVQLVLILMVVLHDFFDVVGPVLMHFRSCLNNPEFH